MPQPRAALIAALLGGLAVLPLAAQPVTPAPLLQGEVTFQVHSTFVGRIHGRAPIARAEFTGERLEAVHGSAVVEVTRMETGNGTRDRHMREAMAADGYPEVRFELTGVRPGEAGAVSTPVTLEGRLTIHGVTRPVTASGSVALRPGGADIAASFSLDMRDYGIKPPVRALVLRVAPDVVVSARLSFGAAVGP